MDDMETKLNSILGNPQMMQQIIAMAQSMGQGSEAPPEKVKEEPAAPPLPDAATLQKLVGFAQRSGVDKNQQALLHALSPYLSDQRIQKLERAMRAAKIAGLAAAALGSGGLSFLTGR